MNSKIILGIIFIAVALPIYPIECLVHVGGGTEPHIIQLSYVTLLQYPLACSVQMCVTDSQSVISYTFATFLSYAMGVLGVLYLIAVVEKEEVKKNDKEKTIQGR